MDLDSIGSDLGDDFGSSGNAMPWNSMSPGRRKLFIVAFVIVALAILAIGGFVIAAFVAVAS